MKKWSCMGSCLERHFLWRSFLMWLLKREWGCHLWIEQEQHCLKWVCLHSEVERLLQMRITQLKRDGITQVKLLILKEDSIVNNLILSCDTRTEMVPAEWVLCQPIDVEMYGQGHTHSLIEVRIVKDSKFVFSNRHEVLRAFLMNQKSAMQYLKCNKILWTVSTLIAPS